MSYNGITDERMNMLYKEIIKQLAKRRGIKLDHLANALGVSQAAFSNRLRDSFNPGIANTAEILDELGYEVVFAPKGVVSKSEALSKDFFVVELPKKNIEI